MAETTWQNCAQQIYAEELKENERHLKRSLSVTMSVAIKKASLQWYKMKWQFTSSANDLWGEEAEGWAEVCAQNPLQHLDTFTAGQIFQLRVRFFNLTNGDDAANDFRGAFLKLSDDESEGPFDLSFTTGSASCFDSTASLQEFLSAICGDEESFRDWAFLRQQNYHALVDGLRRYPACWSCLDYNNHATYRISMQDGSQHLVRFRLKGSDDIDSRLTPEEQKLAWMIGRPDMELPSDTYLHDRLRDIASNPRSMLLQVQLRAEDPDNGDLLNPTLAWDCTAYPWQDVAQIHLTNCTPKASTERAKYNFNKTPEDVELVVPEMGDNFAGLVQIREKVLTNTCRKKRPESVTRQPERKTTFLIHVETGTSLFSGTDAGVYIALYGSKGRTRKMLLDKLFHDDFERGSKEAYYIDAPYIGDVKFVKIYLIGGKYTLNRSWLLRNVVVFDLSTRVMIEIPCYRWVLDKVTLAVGTATLPQHVRDINLTYIRRLDVQERQAEIKWGHDPGMPGKIDCSSYSEIPIDLQFASDRQLQKKFNLTDTMLRLKLHNFTSATSFESFDDHETMARILPQTETFQTMLTKNSWASDVEFGRQFLSGMNPAMIRRCSAALPNFPVTDNDVNGLLDRGMSLEQEMTAGHVYYIDYKTLDNIPRKTKGEKRYLTSPMVLFYVKSNGDFAPIAIQLEQKPGPDNPIWTPHDEQLDWLLVKMWVKSSDTHIHSVISHLFYSHLISESVSVAFLRQLPPTHPVFKLLLPHTRYVIAGAAIGREVLLTGDESVLQKLLAIPGQEVNLMTKHYKTFHYDDLVVPKEFVKRGVANATNLPNYLFREDSLCLWNILHTYVTAMLSEYYVDETCVREDTELQLFIKDVNENGLRSVSEEGNGVPDSFSSRQDLADFCTAFIFRSSCYHAAVNYGQLDYLSFAPNYPSGMRQPPPTRKGETTMDGILETLPHKNGQALAIAFAYYLSEPLSDEIYFGQFPDAHFTDTPARTHIEKFRLELERASNEMKERNKMVDISYEYLLPEVVPNSAAQ